MTSNDTIKVEVIAAVANAVSGLENVAQKLLSGVVAWQTYKKLIVESVQEYMNAEKAAVSLANAFRVQKDYSRQTMESLTRLAEQLQRTTIYEDDATISAMAMLKQLTHLNADGIAKLIPGVQNFASAMGLDLVQAATLVAKTIGSDTNALSRYGIEVKGAQTEAEKLTVVIGQLDDKFGGLAETVGNTTYGQMEKAKNQLADMKEAIGGFVVGYGQDVWSKTYAMVRNFWDVVLLRGSGPGTAAYDYVLKLKGAMSTVPGSGTTGGPSSKDMKQEIISFGLDYVKMLDDIIRHGRTDIELKDEQIAQLAEMRRQLQLVEDTNKNVVLQDSEQLLVQQAINQLVKERDALVAKLPSTLGAGAPSYSFAKMAAIEYMEPEIRAIADAYDDAAAVVGEYNVQLDLAIVSQELLSMKIAETNRTALVAKKVYEDLGEALLNMVSSEIIRGLYDLGYALRGGGDAGDVILETIQTMISNLPMLLLNAGLNAISNNYIELGIMLIAASGLTALVGGGINAAIDAGQSVEERKAASGAEQAGGLLRQQALDAADKNPPARTSAAVGSGTYITVLGSIVDTEGLIRSINEAVR